MQHGLPVPPGFVQASLTEEHYREFTREYWLSTVQARLPVVGNMIPRVSVVDDHIYGLEHALSFAKHVRNLAQPSMKLPVELLAIIFQHLADDWPPLGFQLNTPQEPPQEPRTSFVYHLNWISAALHVCHPWRNNLLQCSSLWSTVDTLATPPQLAPWFIGLSRSAPLRLRTELSRPERKVNNFEILRSVLVPPQIHRLYALDLELCDISIVPALTTAILPTQMPALTYFNLSLAEDLIPAKEDIIYIPVAWLARCFPNLRELHLKQCALTWPASGEAVTLPHLVLFRYIIEDAGRYVSPKSTISLDQMHAFWSSMRHLETVQMTSPAPFVRCPSTPSNEQLYTMHSEPTIDLPNTLKYFGLSSPVASIAPLASMLRMPNHARVELSAFTIDDYSALPLRRFCGPDHPPHTLMFSLSTDEPDPYSPKEWEALISAWDTSPDSTSWTSTSADEPSLNVIGDWSGYRIQTTNPLSEIDLSQLRLLVLAGENRMKVCDPVVSEAFYRKATKLQRLEVADWKVAVDFFGALVPKVGGDIEPLFPQLEDICVGISSEVSEKQGHEREDALGIPSSNDLLRVVSCIAARAARDWIDRIKETGVPVEFVE
ncbi:unnamed protein product [Peniophora sp. CBMAI 1063]|nr:unnamed protein product [Peniophora sp. CBMAI 1063]